MSKKTFIQKKEGETTEQDPILKEKRPRYKSEEKIKTGRYRYRCTVYTTVTAPPPTTTSTWQQKKQKVSTFPDNFSQHLSHSPITYQSSGATVIAYNNEDCPQSLETMRSVPH